METLLERQPSAVPPKQAFTMPRFSPDMWPHKAFINQYCVYARLQESSIVVRVEAKDDPTQAVQWMMEPDLGLTNAMMQAALQTRPEDLGP